MSDMTEHPDTNHKVDKQCYLASHTVCVFHLDVTVHREKTEPLKKQSAQLFVCLLLHSELADDSPVALDFSTTVTNYVSPCHCDGSFYIPMLLVCSGEM